MDKCPIKLVVLQSDNTDHVLVLNFSSKVYRKLDGRYYIIHGYWRLFVEPNDGWSGFVLKLSRQRFLWLLYPPAKKVKHTHVEEEKARSADAGQDRQQDGWR